MSQLRLRIDKYLDTEGSDAPEALANIYSLDAPLRGRTAPTTKRQAMVPISHQPGQARTVEVSPGRYRVEVVLPSGEILADDVRAAEGEVAEVVLKGMDSPHEWLGWQFLVGNVAASSPWTHPNLRRALGAVKPAASGRAAAKPRRAAKKKVAARKNVAARKMSAKKSRPMMESRGARSIMAAAPAAAAKIDDPIFWLSSPWPELLTGSWLMLGERSAQAPAIEELNAGHAPMALAPVVSDPMRAVFRVMHGAGGTRSATGLNSQLPRDFVVVRNGPALELLSLPTPWTVPMSGREAVIEIVVQRMIRPYEFSSSIAVHDEHLALLLGYLSVGSLGNASAIVEHATDLLFGKVQNALAAAAGAYALIGSETDTKPKPWHGWVKNLMDLNPQLPDGAILYAMLKQRRGPSQASEACALFKQACRRGLPYYSLGLRWLLDGLERFAPRDDEAATLARQVRAVSARMHQQSPFTILRLGSR